MAKTNLYDALYERLDRLTAKNCKVVGYVFMPNHIHLLLFVPSTLSVNTVLGESKRWWAKVIIDRLTAQSEHSTLFRLQRDVDSARYQKGQLLRVWDPSSDIKPCRSSFMVQKKLNYIHLNPVRGKWKLSETPETYPHSSAGHYANGSSAGIAIAQWRDVLQQIQIGEL